MKGWWLVLASLGKGLVANLGKGSVASLGEVTAASLGERSVASLGKVSAASLGVRSVALRPVVTASHSAAAVNRGEQRPRQEPTPFVIQGRARFYYLRRPSGSNGLTAAAAAAAAAGSGNRRVPIMQATNQCRVGLIPPNGSGKPARKMRIARSGRRRLRLRLRIREQVLGWVHRLHRWVHGYF